MTDLTLALNILNFLWSERAEDRQMGCEGSEDASGFADAALDVFVCTSVLAHDTAQVGELVHFLDLFLL